MKKIIKFIFLIIVYLSFLIGIANAQKFWVKFIDGNDDGKIIFSLYAASNETQAYYTGIAPYDNTDKRIELLQIPAGSNNSTNVSWEVGDKGFLIYDIYLTPNHNIFYWTSQGNAVGSSTGGSVTIDWFNGSGIKIYEFYFSFSGDRGEIVPVPLPSALWLLGSSLITLGLIRKKLLTH